MRTREILTYHAVGAAVVVLSATFGGAANAQESNDILFRTETRVVEVTLVATDRDGRLVDDLIPEEIRILDKGAEQQVQHFEIVPSALTTGAVDLRHTLFLIDDLNSDAAARARMRAALAEVFPSGIRAEDRAAVVRLGSEGRVLVEFGQNVQSLAGALNEPSSVLLANYDDVEIERRIDVTARLLSTVAKSFENTPGQKNVIWISAGFPLSFVMFGEPPQGWERFPGRLSPQFPPNLSPTNDAREYYTLPPQILRQTGFGRDRDATWSPFPVSRRSVHGLLLPAIKDLNAANVSLYAVDAGGIRYGDGFGGNQAMNYLAVQTGGTAYADRGNTTELIRQSLDDSRSGYVFTYAPSNYAVNDGYHRIRVKTTREGVKLRYRRGYYAQASP